MIEIERVKGSCNSCTQRDIFVNEIFVGKKVNTTYQTISGTAIRLCDDCFGDLLTAMKKEV